MTGFECAMFAISVGFFHDSRKDPIPALQSQWVEQYPEHEKAIDKAYELPIEWHKGKVEVFTEIDCLTEANKEEK